VATVSPAAPESLNAAAPAPLRILLDGIDRLGRLDGGCLLTLLMLAEVATRCLSNFLPFFPPTISIAWEYSSYLMAASFTFGAAMTLRVGGHIRVAAADAAVPGARHPGSARTVARRSSHEGLARRMTTRTTIAPLQKFVMHRGTSHMNLGSKRGHSMQELQIGGTGTATLAAGKQVP
jgi:hypothetical protein